MLERQTDRTLRNDFDIVAIPPQALALRLANLTENGSGALAAAYGHRTESEKRRRDHQADELDAFLAHALAVYQETQARILHSFDIDDEASRLALDEIDRELADNARTRRDMIDRAVKGQDGCALFLTEDGGAIYRESGERVDPKEQRSLLDSRRPELEQAPRWERFHRTDINRNRLEQEQAGIVAAGEEREKLREAVRSGRLDQDELEALEARYDRDVPERVRRYRISAEAQASGMDRTLSAAEIADADSSVQGSPLTARFTRAVDPVLADSDPPAIRRSSVTDCQPAARPSGP